VGATASTEKEVAICETLHTTKSEAQDEDARPQKSRERFGREKREREKGWDVAAI